MTKPAEGMTGGEGKNTPIGCQANAKRGLGKKAM